MSQPTLTLDRSIRAIRIIFAVLLFAAISYILMAEVLFHHEPHDIHVMWVGILVNALLVVGIAFFFRMKMVSTAVETLRTKPDDLSALGRWRAGNIISCVLAESIVLLGFSLRFIGGTPLQSLPFYFTGIAMMILWFPRRP